MKVIGNLFIFALGAAAGSLVTWKIVKTKYERIAQEEIDSVKEVFLKKEKEKDVKEDNIVDDRFAEEAYNNAIAAVKTYKNDIKGDDILVARPYVITPTEYEDNDEYEKATLNVYADKYVTDDFDEILDNAEVDELVGLDALNHFGEYEADTVYVRNDELRTDYELLLDASNYVDTHLPSTVDDDDV